MPERKKGEPLNAFISRFVSNKAERQRVPKLKQRLAIGYSEARREARRG
jgi:hypothetical protein